MFLEVGKIFHGFKGTSINIFLTEIPIVFI